MKGKELHIGLFLEISYLFRGVLKLYRNYFIFHNFDPIRVQIEYLFIRL